MQQENLRKKRDYILCGLLTTMVNMGMFSVFAYGLSLNIAVANLFAWFISVCYAYVANKLIVYRAYLWRWSDQLGEFLRFILCRTASGVFETIGLYIFCDLIRLPSLYLKALLSAFVLCMNYFFSEKVVFSKNNCRHS